MIWETAAAWQGRAETKKNWSLSPISDSVTLSSKLLLYHTSFPSCLSLSLLANDIDLVIIVIPILLFTLSYAHYHIQCWCPPSLSSLSKPTRPSSTRSCSLPHSIPCSRTQCRPSSRTCSSPPRRHSEPAVWRPSPPHWERRGWRIVILTLK